MRSAVKELIMGLLVWACIIWFVAFDPDQLLKWFKIASCLAGVTWFWWWICDFDNPFKADKYGEKA